MESPPVGHEREWCCKVVIVLANWIDSRFKFLNLKSRSTSMSTIFFPVQMTARQCINIIYKKYIIQTLCMIHCHLCDKWDNNHSCYWFWSFNKLWHTIHCMCKSKSTESAGSNLWTATYQPGAHKSFRSPVHNTVIVHLSYSWVHRLVCFSAH